jgi:hypothetical protein
VVCNTENHWVSGLCPSFGILNTRKHCGSEVESFKHMKIKYATLEDGHVGRNM